MTGKGRKEMLQSMERKLASAQSELAAAKTLLECLPDEVDDHLTQFSDFKPYPWVSLTVDSMTEAAVILGKFIKQGWVIQDIESRGHETGIRYINPDHYWEYINTKYVGPTNWHVNEGIALRLETLVTPDSTYYINEVTCWVGRPGVLIRLCIRVETYSGARPYVDRATVQWRGDEGRRRDLGIKKVYPGLGHSIKVQWWADTNSIHGAYYFTLEQFTEWLAENKE